MVLSGLHNDSIKLEIMAATTFMESKQMGEKWAHYSYWADLFDCYQKTGVMGNMSISQQLSYVLVIL